MTDKEKQLQTTPDDGISLRIKSAREAKNLSQIDMHKRTGLSRTVLINYEAGRHKPGTRELKLICDALEVSPNYLIYGTEHPHKIEDGLADQILELGASAYPSLFILTPMIASILDHEEKRTLLKLVEALIKAKSHDLYRDIMSVVAKIPKPEQIDSSQIPTRTELQKNPELMKEYIENTKAIIQNITRK